MLTYFKVQFIMTKEVPIPSKSVKKKCIVCGKKLKIFEYDLCSCKKNVCMKHLPKYSHDCVNKSNIKKYEKIVSQKILKI